VHRISLLASEERSDAGLYVYYRTTHLLLRLPAQEICKICGGVDFLVEDLLIYRVEYGYQVRLLG
jgi:hypothetical protein